MTFNYFEHELSKVMTTPGEPIQLKIRGDVGETRWLVITPKMFDAIEALMISESE